MTEDTEDDLAAAGLEASKLAKALREFGGYVHTHVLNDDLAKFATLPGAVVG